MRCFFSYAVFFTLQEARALGDLALQPHQLLLGLYLSTTRVSIFSEEEEF